MRPAHCLLLASSITTRLVLSAAFCLLLCTAAGMLRAARDMMIGFRDIRLAEPGR